MARYIDADALIEYIQETICAKCGDISDGIKCKSCGIDDTLYFLENAPTADVVPKSEYDAVVSAVDNSTKEFLKLHDDYQKQKVEIEALKDEVKRYKRYYFHHDYDKMIAEAKAEVAREIFDEIERIFDGKKYVPYPLDAIAELKKKYLGEKT